MEEEVVPVLCVEDAGRAVGWYARLGFEKEWEHRFEPGDARPDTLLHLYVNDVDAVSREFGVPVGENGLAGRELALQDPDGNRLRVATRRS